MNENTVQLTLITLAIITQAIVLLQAACRKAGTKTKQSTDFKTKQPGTKS